MIMVLDSYDSFVYNLVRYLVEAGAEVRVVRSDGLSVAEALAMDPAGVVLSPGPCTPSEAGIGLDLVMLLASGDSEPLPLLGVCLGHQVVAQALGGSLRPARPPRHGVARMIHPVPDSPLLEGLPDPFPAGLYHSLSVAPDTLPASLIVTARDDEGEIMGVSHRSRPIHGVQFHPESILTPGGRRIMENFLAMVGGTP